MPTLNIVVESIFCALSLAARTFDQSPRVGLACRARTFIGGLILAWYFWVGDSGCISGMLIWRATNSQQFWLAQRFTAAISGFGSGMQSFKPGCGKIRVSYQGIALSNTGSPSKSIAPLGLGSELEFSAASLSRCGTDSDMEATFPAGKLLAQDNHAVRAVHCRSPTGKIWFTELE